MQSSALILFVEVCILYRALYRKWRPQTFAEVVGQEPIITALTNQIGAGRVGHAYLFTGSRGTGKTTCAKIFAKAVNCTDPNGVEPCGKCSCCVGIENGSTFDVTEIDAASNNGVDDVRDLRDETAYRPSDCRYKVYIIDEVHMLSISAFNALLKIMEEPPSHVIFILATTEIHKVPPTILSRCQRFDFARIDAELIARRLMEIAAAEDITLSQPAADLIARLADGALRDALSLLDTCAGSSQTVDADLVRSLAGITDKDYLFALSDAVAKSDLPALLEKINDLRGRSIEIKRLAEELVFHYRSFLLAAADPAGALLSAMPADEKQRYLNAAEQSEAFLIRAIKRLSLALDKMGRAPDPRVELELALIDMMQLEEGAQNSAENPQKPQSFPNKTAPAQKEAPGPQIPAEKEQKPPEIESPSFSVSSAPEAAKAPAQKEQNEAAEPPGAGGAEVQPPAAPQPYPAWEGIVARMAEVDGMLYSYMKDTSAYYDGKRMLIDGGDMFLSFMREYDGAAQTIKDVIQQVAGLRCGIGPYTEKGREKPVKSAHETLRELQERGLPIEYGSSQNQGE